MYVEDEIGKKIVCTHPGEDFVIKKVLGENAFKSEKLVRERTGFNSDCICLNCLFQFKADFSDETVNPYRSEIHQTQQPKDKRECPRCHSGRVKTVFEMIDGSCPKCKEGKITKTCIGIS